VLVDAVSDIETLTNGISRKIWQKLMILDLLDKDQTSLTLDVEES